MSDLQEQINRILSDPNALKQVQSLGEQLGLSEKPQSVPAPPSPQNELMSAVSGLAPLFGSQGEDDVSRLLSALRPFLSEEKRNRLDRASRLLRLVKLLPLLKDSGIF